MTTPEDREIWERDEEALRDEVRQLSATLDRASRDTIQQAREYRALVAELEALRAEVERLRATVARVEAVRGTFGLCPDHEAVVVNCDHCWAWAGQEELQGRIDSALADAPAEQRAEGGA